MRVTIVPPDNIVFIGDQMATLDLSALLDTIHAVQWDGTRGEIERLRDGAISISSLDQFAEIIARASDIIAANAAQG